MIVGAELSAWPLGAPEDGSALRDGVALAAAVVVTAALELVLLT